MIQLSHYYRYSRILIVFSFAIMTTSCDRSNFEKKTCAVQKDSLVTATVQTEPVLAQSNEDAADDPAIWYNRENPAKSLVIGTNKKGGINVYDLSGKELYYYPVGLVNNIDLRYDFPLSDGRKIDIVAATNRSDNSIEIHRIDPLTGALINVAARKIISKVGEVYGIALYHSAKSGKYFVFVGGKMGETEQYELFASENNTVDAILVRSFNFASQSEGMVADDELGFLYIAEEDCCIWKIDAEPNKSFNPVKLAQSDSTNTKLSYDLEGLAIYYTKNKKGYLIASSQGNYSYAIFEREKDNQYLGSFSIATGIIDGVEETDGLDVTNLNLGPQFKQGLFVVQDGYNYEGDSLKNQNFKLIPWEQIASLFKPALSIDTEYQPNTRKGRK